MTPARGAAAHHSKIAYSSLKCTQERNFAAETRGYSSGIAYSPPDCTQMRNFGRTGAVVVWWRLPVPGPGGSGHAESGRKGPSPNRPISPQSANLYGRARTRVSGRKGPSAGGQSIRPVICANRGDPAATMPATMPATSAMSAGRKQMVRITVLSSNFSELRVVLVACMSYTSFRCLSGSTYGRLAQGESASLTRKRSQVQIL